MAVMRHLLEQARLGSLLVARRRLHHYRVLVVGGGAGGCAAASKFAGRAGAGGLAVVEPADTHYYQPMWTLVGGGIKSLSASARPMGDVLPRGAHWVKDSVVRFEPEANRVVTGGGQEITYDFLVVSMGIELRYNAVKGLPEAFETPGVCSNYSHKYVEKTTKAIQEFKGGNAVFTFPNSPVKCAGAPQKIMYIAEQAFREKGIKANVEYFTSLQVLFGVKKYADALWKVAEERNISVNLRHNLIEVKPDSREAIFENLDSNETVSEHYDLLHVTPPMGPPRILSEAKDLADPAGFLDLNKETLQHKKYQNIFGLGDCTNLPNAKTAAAVAAQIGILRRNLQAALNGEELPGVYDGYTSCPLVTGRSSCILAEFDFQAPPQPLETFPFNQAKERRSMFLLKAHMMPFLYWNGLLKGYWEGPAVFRRIMNLNFSK